MKDLKKYNQSPGEGLGMIVEIVPIIGGGAAISFSGRVALVNASALPGPFGKVPYIVISIRGASWRYEHKRSSQRRCTLWMTTIPSPTSTILSNIDLTQSEKVSALNIPVVRACNTPPSFRKTQFLLGFTIDNFFLHYPLERVVFITLTFPLATKDTGYANKKLNSLLNKVRKMHPGYIWVLQPHLSGAIHYHVLAPVQFDCHEGTALNDWADGILKTDHEKRESLNPQFQALWDLWQETAHNYHFGKVEVAPIYSNANAIRCYLTRQDWRKWEWPFEETARFRFWSRSNNLKAGSTKFSWAKALFYRKELQEWAAKQGCQCMDELRDKFGSHWNWLFRCHLEQQRLAQQSSTSYPLL